MGRRLHQTSLAVALGLGLGLALAAASPPAAAAIVALALEINGASEPAIEPFTELESGTSIDLGEATEIEFLHYTTCQTIIVRGGRITFTEQQFLVRGGETVAAKRTKCPEVADVGEDSSIGGVLMRGYGDNLKLRPKPRFAFVGASRTAYGELRVVKGETELLREKLARYRFDWPDSKAPLAAGDGYALELVGKGGAKKRIEFEVAARRGTAPLTVIRLD